MSEWSPYQTGRTIGTVGSESGRIILDEEHPGGARITIECLDQGSPFSITCGIHGYMVLTRYFYGEDEARQQCIAMKEALSLLLSRSPDDPDESDLFGEFVDRFP